jgi:DNA topoisomerase-1
MAKNLLIVESPAKAKTIEKYLGKDFVVKSSYGHIRDLDKGADAVNVENDFEPLYVVSPDKTKVVKELKDALKKSEEVWLATDEDREGEAISWHLCEVLGLDYANTKRIVFREITKPAIQNAVKNPRRVDVNLVNAQQARRILDRLVGYELSQILWKKVKGNLSAGRVQSVAVKLVVEREREIINFEVSSFYKLYAYFLVKNEQGKEVELKAELSEKVNTDKEIESILVLGKSAQFAIRDIVVKPAKRRPAPPFTTSTLQQEASRKLGFNVNRTMQVAQRLYEAGHISYMRTDSTMLSQTALDGIAMQIRSDYGDKYLHTRQYSGKKQLAQEAHEAIRPTDFNMRNVALGKEESRLYDLIWKRTVASQMSDAILEKTTVEITMSNAAELLFKAEGEVLKFDGFLKLYLEGKDDDDEESKGILPPLKVGMPLLLDKMEGVQKYTRPPARYTEAALVKKLEELGIGRPSTYAPTISRITEQGKGYVVIESRPGVQREYKVLSLVLGQISSKVETENTGAGKNHLYPTDMGMVVVDFLDEHFQEIMDYGFTADIEEKFDRVAEGMEEWNKMLKKFYEGFHEDVVKTLQEASRASGERVLGKDPVSGKTLLVRMSKFGRPIAQIGAPDELSEGEMPRYANLLNHQSIETITSEEALELFVLPRTIGTYEGTEVVANSGRYGPYIKFGEGKFVSLKAGQDPFTISFEEAAQLIREKVEADAPKGLYKGEPYTIGKGRFGPFIKYKNIYVNIPKKYNPEDLSATEAQELIEAKIQKEAERYIRVWDEEKIAIENGRWGPFIRFGKENVKLPPGHDGNKMTAEEAQILSLEEVKTIIKGRIPGAFDEKKAKTAPKKTTAKAKVPKKK